jgi:hypothetical protein
LLLYKGFTLKVATAMFAEVESFPLSVQHKTEVALLF